MKKYNVFLTPDAIQDLTEVYEYILDASEIPEVAWSHIEKLRDKYYDLKTMPLRGHRLDDLRNNLRVLVIDSSHTKLMKKRKP